ncbi:MAG: hypothetical protein ACE5D0_06645 [Fidelibacterota bacterium]
MTGTAVSFTNFSPIHDINDGSEEGHVGEIDLLVTNFYGLYGLTNNLNLSISFPYKYWRQFEVEHEDAHHRNDKQKGIGDMTLGLRKIVINESFGPGQRLFFDGSLTLPTGKHYELNPFGTDADSVNHSHFALGTGQVSYSLGSEWWRRSEFPFIIGVSSIFKQAVTESNVGFKPGSTVSLTFHAIRQASIIKSVFPYMQLKYRREWPDEWEGKAAPNSGAAFLDFSGQLIYEVSEQSSLVFTIGFPLWQAVEGSQLTGVNYALSFRFKSI